MTAFADLIGRVSPSCPQCPAPVVEEYLRFSAIDFCRQSMAWTETLPSESLAAANFPFEVLPSAADAKTIRVLSVIMDGQAPGLEPISARDAVLSVGDWQTATGTPQYFVNLPKGSVQVVRLPEAAASFVFTIACEPLTDATDMPDEILDDWMVPIISGAISSLAAIPGKPWTSGDVYALHRQIFKEGIEDARREFHTHHVLPTMSVSPSPI